MTARTRYAWLVLEVACLVSLLGSDAKAARQRFGFSWKREEFLALRRLLPEFSEVRVANLAPEGQKLWEADPRMVVYNNGEYLEEDVNHDGQPDAALLLYAARPGEPEQPYVLLATRPAAGFAWTRVALIRLPASTPQGLPVDHVMQRLACEGNPEMRQHLRGDAPTPEACAEGAGAERGVPYSEISKRLEALDQITDWPARLTDPEPRIRLEAVYALGRSGLEARQAIDLLVERLYDREASVRNAAVEALQTIGPDVVPALRQLILREGSTHGRHDPGARSQRLAVDLLGRLTPVTDEAVDLAAEVCRKRAIHDVVRHDACVSLAALGDREPQVRQEAIETLLSVFQESDADLSLRMELIHALGRLGPEASVVTTLAHALQDREVFIRRTAAGTLAQFGGSARSALPALRTALSDADPEVKASVQRAIEQMEKGQ